MSAAPELWLNPLLAALHDGQVALGGLADALGLAGRSHGQAAWPWSRRVATETLAIDRGLAREVGFALIASTLALLLALAALLWRRARWPLAACALAAAWFAPWPPAALWLTPAAPTSFQASPAEFSVATTLHGAQVYAQHCIACHGASGRGDGPQADALPVWPPTVAGPLLARRLDGELFWHVAAGMHDRDGHTTMPAFAGRLDDRDIWAALDYLRVLSAAGGSESGAGWPVPLPIPALDVRCADGATQTLSHWRSGQRVRIVALDAGAVPPFEDARWQTLLLTRDSRPPTQVPADGPRATCTAVTPGAWTIFSTIADRPAAAFAGAELIADRDGWLRAAAAPGARWSDANLMCGVEADRERAAAARNGASGNPANAPGGIDTLLARIDAEPVSNIQGGYPH
ncbi:cytochrome c [Burkholderia sp. 22PA0099]|uniref:c-type cytochrome n=1 Tax=Burkholderia sp. 22PA0099 TaxID=3237372 RepID=UPI0039C06491